MARRRLALLATTLVGSLAVMGADGCKILHLSEVITGKPSDRFGFRICRGDLNADGIDDLCVSAPNPGFDRVYVFFGGDKPAPPQGGPNPGGNQGFEEIDFGQPDPGNKGGGPRPKPDVADADAMFVGASMGEAGWSVATGDVTGDGIDDLLIGAPSEAASAGVVYVVDGPLARGQVYRPADVWATLTGEPHAGGTGPFAGWDVAAGDVDGDGQKDLLVGAPMRSIGNALQVGRTYVVYGPIIDGQHALADADAKIDGEGPGSQFGYEISTGGDVDGDGLEDLLIASPNNRPAGGGAANLRGHVHLLYGGTRPAGSMTIAQAAAATFEGVTPGGQLGIATALDGDFNADGFSDIALGAPRLHCVEKMELNGAYPAGFQCVAEPGAVYVFNGSQQRFAGTISASNASRKLDGDAVVDDGFGLSIAYGDMNGTGTSDLLIGSFINRAYLIDSEAAKALRFEGRNPDEALGMAVAAADYNADGSMDFVVGAPAQKVFELPSMQPGKVHIGFGFGGP